MVNLRQEPNLLPQRKGRKQIREKYKIEQLINNYPQLWQEV
jgi:hypothetical protein